MLRSQTFLDAVRSGNYAATAISTHPGVTTMWLGSAGLLLHSALGALGLLADDAFPTRLMLLRLPVVLAHVGGILTGYGLLRRILPGATAALAAILWAADPFVVGYSQLLHVDALAGTFATVSLLAACNYWYSERQTGSLLLSGVCAGLALFSKSPALVVVPVVALIAWVAWQGERATTKDEQAPWPSVIRRSSFVSLLVWGLVAAATVVALWPALWTDPVRAYHQIQLGVAAEGAEPHMLGNFFLGREDDAPGVLFYPVALVLRLTPWTLLGVMLVPLAWRQTRATPRHILGALAAFAVFFIIAMSPFPKKFNRYLVPIFPSVDVLAAVSLAWAATRLPFLLHGYNTCIRVLQRGIAEVYLFCVALLALLTATQWGNYTIAAFNPALGGEVRGAQTFMVGWGEGLEQAAAWLNQQPDITGVLTLSTTTRPLQPYLRKGAQAITPSTSTLPKDAGYMVIYIRDVLTGFVPPPFDQFFGRVTPLYIVRIGGVDYAWIYQLPPFVDQPRPADFGSAIHLLGFEQHGSSKHGQELTFKLFWEAYTEPPANYTLFAHLIGPDGHRYTQVDLPYPTGDWQARRYVTTELPISAPEHGPAGRYQLMIGFYDPNTGQRLPLASSLRIDPQVDGADALQLTTLRLDPRP
jgi:hypothetical protein